VETFPFMRLLLLAFMPAIHALACDCMRVKTFCEQPPDPGAKDAAIFVGTVTDQYPPLAASESAAQIEANIMRWRNDLTEVEFQNAWKNRSYAPDGPRLFRLSVTEIFQGAAGSEVVMAGGWGDCDFQFRVGETYLVAAHRTEQSRRLSATICSQSRILGDAQGDLRALRAWRTGATLSPLLYGRVLDYTSRAGAYRDRPKPIASVRVRLDVDGVVRNTFSDPAGSFVFENVKPGAIRLTTDLKPMSFERVEVSDPPLFGPTCRQVNVKLTETQSVQGRVILRGAPHTAIELQLVPVGGGAIWPRDIAMASADGSFSLSLLEPGDYVLQVRLWRFAAPVSSENFYPGATDKSAAQILHIKKGEIIRLQDWILPPFLGDDDVGQVGNLLPIGNRPVNSEFQLTRRIANPPQVTNLPHTNVVRFFTELVAVAQAASLG
jgi:hypothetical protein